MSNWVKHTLKYEKVKLYVDSALELMNTLSDVLKTFDFTKGKFFTFLPPEMNMEEIYNLKYALSCLYTGGPFQELPDRVPAAEVLLAKAKTNPHFNCLFDNIVESPSDPIVIANPDECLVYYQEEVYFFVRNSQLSFHVCADYLDKSNVIRHSLCVVSDVDLPTDQKEISLSFLQEISQRAQFILIGAYDGDSYLYWEKNSD